MGMGFAMANQMAGAMAPQPQPAAQPQAQAGVAPVASPPPLPAQVLYHAAIDGQSAGPFDMPTLRVKAAGGEITRDTLVWTAGMPGWAKASQRADLQSLFEQTPPPLPSS